MDQCSAFATLSLPCLSVFPWLVAASYYLAGSLVAEGSSPIKAGADGTFGYLGSKVYAPLVAYLALGPGIVGHTGGTYLTD
jgi:hypothetical protein